MKVNRAHHIAVIVSDYKKSKKFYTEVLGFTILAENYREARKSYKLDLALNGDYLLELFSFPETPPRVSGPEACGLRHLAFEVDNVEEALDELKSKNIKTTPIQIDEYTGKKMGFFFDPDDLPLELYEK